MESACDFGCMGMCPAIDRPCDDLCKIEHDNAFTHDVRMHTLRIYTSNQNVKTLARNLTQSVSAADSTCLRPNPAAGFDGNCWGGHPWECRWRSEVLYLMRWCTSKVCACFTPRLVMRRLRLVIWDVHYRMWYTVLDPLWWDQAYVFMPQSICVATGCLSYVSICVYVCSV